jgi:hypothetical protein
MLAPGFLPFWRYTFLLPELSQHPGQQNAPRYLFPLAGDRHGLRRVVPREQPPAPG